MKKAFIFLIIIFLSSQLNAQNKNSIVILAKPKTDGVWLRWAPMNVVSWQLGNKYGYSIERFTLQPNGDLEPGSAIKLTSLPIKPYSEEQFKKLSNLSDEASAIEELLYSEEFKNSHVGNDIGTVLSKNKELENRFGMALLMCDFSIEAAQVAGLFWKDEKAQKNKRYIYRIKVASPTQVNPVEPATVVVPVTDEKPLPVIKNLTATFGDHKTTLTWSTILHKGVYTAYYIEKSADGKNFKKLTDLPYVHMSQKLQSEEANFVDSLDVNQKTYYYRISGISPFAETGPYSNVVSGEGKDNLSGLLIIREGKVIEQKRIRIAWEFPLQAEGQISGFMVSSSSSPDGPFLDANPKPLLKNLREFYHETPFYNTYYILRAVDKTGTEITRSFPYLVQIPDETPPANPTGLTGTMAKTGVSTLTWNKNTDTDLLGYRVFRANALHEEFVEVTKEILPTPFFTDTINLHALNKKIYYAVIAVDKNFNPSDYSNQLKLTRPDIIPPANPVFIKTEMKKDSILLQWENSVSDDIQKYELTRIEKTDKLNRIVKTWYPTDSLTHYYDVGMTLGKTYAYKIVVVDSSGNKSEATSREVFFETGLRKPVSSLKANTDREKKTIDLTWKNERESVKCIIYRKMNDGKFLIYKTFEGNIESFTDKNIPISNTYSYKVQVVFKKGIKTELSEAVTVNF